MSSQTNKSFLTTFSISVSHTTEVSVDAYSISGIVIVSTPAASKSGEAFVTRLHHLACPAMILIGILSNGDRKPGFGVRPEANHGMNRSLERFQWPHVVG